MSQSQQDDLNSFRMSHPAPIVWVNLMKSVQFDKKQAPRYKVAFVLGPDHPDLKRLKAQLGEIAKAKFGTVQGIKYPIQNGSEVADKGEGNKRDYEFARGNVILSAHSIDADDRYPPRLVLFRGADVEPQAFIDETRPLAAKYFYSGVHCVGLFKFGTYDPPLGPGVHAYINRIMSFNVGEKIKTGTDDAGAFGGMEQFKGYVGAVTQEDVTKGMLDDEIPF
jgi:hypothetical protein